MNCVHWLHPFNGLIFLGVWFHVTLNLLLQATAERGGPVLSSSPLPLALILSSCTAWVRSASWSDQKNSIFGGLAILTIQWADPKVPNHSRTTQFFSHTKETQSWQGESKVKTSPFSSSLYHHNSHCTAPTYMFLLLWLIRLFSEMTLYSKFMEN